MKMKLIGLLSILGELLGVASAISVTSQSSHNLGVDPEGSARLNGMSFQQDVITTYKGWYVPSLSCLFCPYPKQRIHINFSPGNM
jgi:hypothetical protein